MTITTSEFSKKMEAYTRTIDVINQLAKETYLPEALKEELKNLRKTFEAYDMQQHAQSLREVSGTRLTRKKIKEILGNSSYSEWSIEESTSESVYWSNDFKKNYNINIDPSEIVIFECFSSSDSRDEVCSIVFYCIPGYTLISASSDRAGISSDGLLPNSQVYEYVESCFE